MEAIKELYYGLMDASIHKDRKMMQEILSKDYVLIHMTGLHQSANQFIDSVMDGTLNYYEVEHEEVNVIDLDDRYARIVAKSRVKAKVYGGLTHTWPLKQLIKCRKEEDGWKIVESKASMY